MTKMIMTMVAAALLMSCAGGAKFSDSVAKLPAPKQGEGRIWFFRPQKVLGCAVQPAVRLNGQIVGTAKPGGFFHVDRPAGQYEASCTTEWSHNTNFTLAAQSNKYIRLVLLPGIFVGHVVPKEDNSADAMEDLRDLNANN